MSLTVMSAMCSFSSGELTASSSCIVLMLQYLQSQLEEVQHLPTKVNRKEFTCFLAP